MLSGDPELDDLSVMLQAHRIDWGQRRGKMIEIIDKLGGKITLRASDIDIERAREVVRNATLEQFRRNLIGELVDEAELLSIGSDKP